MSEFQTYHFKTIDRPLTNKEQAAINQLSSRFSTTATSYSLSYAYSDFRHDEEKVLEKYFDAFLYEASWGARKLMFRFPKTLVDVKALKQYIVDDEEYSRVIVKTKGKWTLLKIEFGIEGGWEEWIQEEPYWLDNMVELREDIINGDYSSLYLFWSKIRTEILEYNEDEEEFDESQLSKKPPVPHNLKKRSSALNSFADFFHIYDDVIKQAAKESKNVSNKIDYENLILKLSDDEKNEWLKRLIKNEPRLDLLLRKRLEKL